MITESFDIESKPLITLRDFCGEPRQLADVCIVTFSTVIYQTLLSERQCSKAAVIKACNGDIPIHLFEYRGRKIVFFLSPLGSAMASETLMEACWMTGAKKAVMFGSSGSLDREKTSNRFVIPTEAYRDEGMSYHFAPAADYITVKNSGVVKAVFDDLKLPYVLGRIWSTDAIMRETAGLAAKRRAEGCIAVDMETAGAQAVCDFCGLELYSFLVTGDVLSEDSYSLGTLADANHNIDKLQIALELAARV